MGVRVGVRVRVRVTARAGDGEQPGEAGDGKDGEGGHLRVGIGSGLSWGYFLGKGQGLVTANL